MTPTPKPSAGAMRAADLIHAKPCGCSCCDSQRLMIANIIDHDSGLREMAEALANARAALQRIQPQVKGVLPREDVSIAIESINAALARYHGKEGQ